MRLAKFLSEPSHDNGYFFIGSVLSAGLLYVHSGIFHEKSPGKRSQFFLLLDKKEKRPTHHRRGG
jgi:hypothetical protein